MKSLGDFKKRSDTMYCFNMNTVNTVLRKDLRELVKKQGDQLRNQMVVQTRVVTVKVVKSFCY